MLNLSYVFLALSSYPLCLSDIWPVVRCAGRDVIVVLLPEPVVHGCIVVGGLAVLARSVLLEGAALDTDCVMHGWRDNRLWSRRI